MADKQTWIVGEAVFCWSQVSNTFFKGTVEFSDQNLLKVRMFSNGKVYSFRSDGTGYFSNGTTSRRVFSVRELNQFTSTETAR